MSDFLPSDYKIPQSGGNYTKLNKGDNVIRILTSPIIGWEDWTEIDGKKKPIRFRMNEKPGAPINKLRPIKHFWAMVVWDYNAKAIQIFQITQSSIQKAIKALVEDEDWGKPFDYDIKITKEGEDLETRYIINPKPKKAVSKEIMAEFDKTEINLDALFTGENPFGKKDMESEMDELMNAIE